MWSIFQTIKRSWSQHFIAQFSAVVIMTTTYTALIFIALSLGNIQKFFDAWGQVHRASIYWGASVESKNKDKIIDQIKAKPIVRNINVVTSDQSALQFKRKFSSLSSHKLDSKKLKKYFPEYHVLELEPTLAYKSGVGALEDFVSDIKKTHPEIQNVSYGKNWIERYVSVLIGLRTLGWFLIFTFLLAALVVSSNVVKTILYSKRDEIEILEFIGADDAYIYFPQVVNAMLICVVSFFLGLAINFIVCYQIKYLESSILSREVLSSIEFLSPSVWFSLFALSLVSVMLYSLMTIFNLLPRRKKALLIKGVVKT